MSDIISNAGAAGPDAASVPTPPAQPALPSDADRIARASAAMFKSTGASTQTPPTQPAPEPVAATQPPAGQLAAVEPKPGEPSLAEVLRARREAAAKAQAEAQKRTSVEQELAAAREELTRLRSSANFEDDPVGFAKARKWTPEQQLLYGQSLLYDLAPDKADPDFRVKMFEDRQKRKEAEEAEAKAKAEAEAAEQARQAQMQQFYHDTAAAVRSFEAGSFPESEAWFGDDVNAYLQSLMATAKNVAIRAQRAGQVADLRPEALAAILEAETSRRMAARDERKQKRQPALPVQQMAAQPAPSDTQPDISTFSTRNMTGSGSPRPPATDEKERIRRAAEAAFRRT